MEAFDNHNYCASCLDKGKGSDPGLLKQECSFCITSIYAVWHIGIASSPHFVASSVGGAVCRRHTLYSGQYLKNGLSDLIQIWHVDVTGPQGAPYC